MDNSTLSSTIASALSTANVTEGSPTTQEEARSRVPFGEEDSTVFPGLSKAEEVVVWAAIVVAILGAGAILLRLVMPLIRRKRKGGKAGKALSGGNGSSGNLFAASTPTSSSRSSTLSRASNLDDVTTHKARHADDVTFVSTVSASPESLKNLYYAGNGHAHADKLSLPVHTSRAMKSSHPVHKSASSQRLLNDQLTSVLSTPPLQRLQSLNLSDDYRNNWDRAFSPNSPVSHSLSAHGHPSENRQLPAVYGESPQQTHRTPAELKTRF